MTQRVLEVDSVAVTAAFAMALKYLAIHQVLDDFLGRPFGNADPLRHLPQHRIGIKRKADQHMGMVVEKGPLLGDRIGGDIARHRSIHLHLFLRKQ